ncbi:putative coil containing protein [Vibrio phage 456E52-1]|nr:putative coil containing protein [Vibrio phage 456E52-1]
MLQIAISKLEQHKKFTIVFIGGSHDGEVRQVDRLPPVVNMQPPVNPTVSATKEGEAIKPCIAQQYKHHNLSLDSPRVTSNTTAILYVHEALTDTEVLNIILTRYVQGTGSENK